MSLNLTHLTLRNIGCIESLDLDMPWAGVIYVKGASEQGLVIETEASDG